MHCPHGLSTWISYKATTFLSVIVCERHDVWKSLKPPESFCRMTALPCKNYLHMLAMPLKECVFLCVPTCFYLYILSFSLYLMSDRHQLHQWLTGGAPQSCERALGVFRGSWGGGGKERRPRRQSSGLHVSPPTRILSQAALILWILHVRLQCRMPLEEEILCL